MQVEVLKLNSGIGHSTVSTAQLQSQNELMRANVARLADDQRIESMAAGMGMVMSQPSAVRFLPADGSAEAVRAAAAVQPPDAAGFAARRQTTTSATAAASTATAGASTAGAATAPATSTNG